MIVFPSFLIFLFVVYLLSKDDFVLLRRNVSLEQVFDMVFLMAVVTLFVSRLAFVVLHFTINYLNPLVFFIIPYFPGLSFAGALLGGMGFLLFYGRYTKIPTGRLSDILSLGLSFSLVGALLVLGGQSLFHKAYLLGALTGGLSIVLLAISLIANRIYAKARWWDGALSTFLLTFITLVSLIYTMLLLLLTKQPLFDKELLLYAGFLVGLVIVSIRYLPMLQRKTRV